MTWCTDLLVAMEKANCIIAKLAYFSPGISVVLV